MIRLRNLAGLLFLAGLFTACGLLEEVMPEEAAVTSKIEITGAETGSLLVDEANFTYTIYNQPGAQESSMHILIGGIGNSNASLQLSLTESNNGNGFSEGVGYFSTSNQQSSVFFTPIYSSGTNVYTLMNSTAETNMIMFTLIRESAIEAMFEVNLESVRGDKVKLTGSFQAVGETFIY